MRLLNRPHRFLQLNQGFDSPCCFDLACICFKVSTIPQVATQRHRSRPTHCFLQSLYALSKSSVSLKHMSTSSTNRRQFDVCYEVTCLTSPQASQPKKHQEDDSLKIIRTHLLIPAIPMETSQTLASSLLTRIHILSRSLTIV